MRRRPAPALQGLRRAYTVLLEHPVEGGTVETVCGSFAEAGAIAEARAKAVAAHPGTQPLEWAWQTVTGRPV